MSGEFRRPDMSNPPPTVRLAGPASVPRRFSSVQMMAVRPDDGAPLSSGRMLDESIEFDFDADGALELDCLPSSHRPRVEQPRQFEHGSPPASRANGKRLPGVLPPAPSWPVASAGPRRTTSSGTHEAAGSRAAFVAFGGFGDVPPGAFRLPGYAVRVLLRKRVLRGDLARARVQRSQDVALYEESLRTADDAAVRNGIVMILLALVAAGASAVALARLLVPLLR